MQQKSFSVRLDDKILTQMTQRLLPFISQSSSIIPDVVLCAFMYCCVFDSERNISKKDILESSKIIPSSDNIQRFRMYANILSWLEDYYGATSISEVVKCCLKEIELLPSLNEIQPPLHDRDTICPRPGNKSNEILSWITSIIKEATSTYNITSYAEVFAGTSNVLMHLPKYEKEYLNDKDSDMVNTLNIIKDNLFLLLEILMNLQVDKSTHEKCLEMIQKEYSFERNSTKRAMRAAGYLFLHLTAFCENINTFNTHCSKNVAKNRVEVLARASVRLQDVTIKNNDYQTFISFLKEEFPEMNGLLLYYDPPYINSEDVYSVCKSSLKNKTKEEKKLLLDKFHANLSKTVLALAKKGALVLVSYRATPPSKAYKESNSAKKADAEKAVREALDSLYMDKDLFVGFMPVPKKETQLEILIANFEFKCSEPYNRKLDDIIKALKLN